MKMFRSMTAGLSVMLASLACAAPACANDVKIVLDDVRGDGGALLIALQDEGQFMADAMVAGERIEAPAAGRIAVTLKDVPDGRYALTVWHDLDGDGRFSMGAMGPTDGWAMIGGAALRGEPDFATVSFTVAGEDVTVRETMIYPREGTSE